MNEDTDSYIHYGEEKTVKKSQQKLTFFDII